MRAGSVTHTPAPPFTSGVLVRTRVPPRPAPPQAFYLLWAPGSTGGEAPPEAGYALGGDSGVTWVALQVGAGGGAVCGGWCGAGPGGARECEGTGGAAGGYIEM